MDRLSVAVRHYIHNKPISCEIISGDINGFCTLKLNEDPWAGTPPVKGDPLLIGIKSGNDIKTIGGTLVDYKADEQAIIVSSDKVFEFIEKRAYERSPISLDGDMKSLVNISNRAAVCVKDISCVGMRIYTYGSFHVGEPIALNLDMGSNVSTFEGNIMRSATKFDRNEYGVQFMYRDKSEIYRATEGVNKLVETEKQGLENFLRANNIKL